MSCNYVYTSLAPGLDPPPKDTAALYLVTVQESDCVCFVHLEGFMTHCLAEQLKGFQLQLIIYMYAPDICHLSAS